MRAQERRIASLELELSLLAPENNPVQLEELLASTWPGSAPLDPRRPNPIGGLIDATYHHTLPGRPGDSENDHD